MKQINGTITLAFLEEDNLQRVIFRVVPLCTKDGTLFTDKDSAFPDQGSLRIVPDKREQSTFKERMRSMGSLCAIQLCADGKELAKVRQNRNYDPAQGEANQFAIYSDVICEFAENGILEVFSENEDTTVAVTDAVLIEKAKVLYGPVEKGAPSDGEELRPFGNDRYLLQTATLPDGSTHRFYWDPDATVSWRQRRGSLRRNKLRADEDAPTELATDTELSASPIKPITPQEQPLPTPVAEKVEKPAVKPVAARQPKPEKPTEPKPELKKPEPKRAPENAAASEALPKRAESKKPVAEKPLAEEKPVARPVRKPVKEAENVLPIGAKLDILDNSLPFEEQLSQLAQPLSGGANRLDDAPQTAEPEEDVTPVRFTGTPLAKVARKAMRTIHQAEPLHYVVEKHLRETKRDDDELKPLDNPIDRLTLELEKIWRSPETKERALEVLLQDEAFMQPLMKRMQQQGKELRVVDAAQAQLEDIEAERLSLLMDLDACKNERKKAQEALLAEASQKKRAELERLDEQIRALKEEKAALQLTLCREGDEAAKAAKEHLTLLCASEGEQITLSPTIGVKRELAEMVELVRNAMNRRGYACNEDEMTELLLHFAVDEEFCLMADTVEDAATYAQTMLDALGLTSVTAHTAMTTKLELVSTLPQNGLRTPTVELCPIGRAALSAFGHRTIRLMARDTPVTPELPLPIVVAPQFRTTLRARDEKEYVPATSFESFEVLCNDVRPLLAEGEEWFAELERRSEEEGMNPSKVVMQRMRIYVSVASRKLRGGFMAAVDAAMLAWGVPMIRSKGIDGERLKQELSCLPRCLKALDIH